MRIVQGHRNLWKPPGYELWKLPRYRSSESRTIADAARELEIGTEQFRKSVRQDEDDRGARDDRLISEDAEELEPAHPHHDSPLAGQRIGWVVDRAAEAELDVSLRQLVEDVAGVGQ